MSSGTTASETPASAQQADISSQLPAAQQALSQPRFHVHTSDLIKSVVVNRPQSRRQDTEHASTSDSAPDPLKDENLRLVADEYRKWRHIQVINARRLRVENERRHAAWQFHESSIVLDAARKGSYYISLEPQTAIDVARAAREILLSEEHLLLAVIREREEELVDLRDALEEVHARVGDADRQVGVLSSVFERLGIPIELSKGPMPYTGPLNLQSKAEDTNSVPESHSNPDSSTESGSE